MVRRCVYTLVLVAIAVVCGMAADVAEQMHEMTNGGRSKVIWARSTNESGWGNISQPVSANRCILMGFDSNTGTETVIDDSLHNIIRPLISHDGSRIVWSSGDTGAIYIINWDGTGKRKLADGIAGALWYDQSTGNEYVLYAKNCILYRSYIDTAYAVYRLNLDDPADTVKVLDPEVHDYDRIQPHFMGTSADNRYIAVLIGWPEMRMFDWANNIPGLTGGGCWTSMPYDTVQRLVYLNSDHNGVNVQLMGSLHSLWLCPESESGSITECGIDHPRMSSWNPSYLCYIDEPDEGEGTGPGRVCVAKVSRDVEYIYKKVEVTDGADGWPDVWVEEQPYTPGFSAFFSAGAEYSQVNDRKAAIMPLGANATASDDGHASYRYYLWQHLRKNGYAFNVDFVGTMSGVGEDSSDIPAYADFDLDHEGHPGYAIAEIADSLDAYLSQSVPDIVISYLGMQDIIAGVDPDTAAREMKTVIEKLRVSNPRVVIIMGLLAPLMDADSAEEAAHASLNEKLAHCAAASDLPLSPVILVDLSSGFTISDYKADGITLNDSGEKKMADRWGSALVRVLDEVIGKPAILSPSTGIFGKHQTWQMVGIVRFPLAERNVRYAGIFVDGVLRRKAPTVRWSLPDSSGIAYRVTCDFSGKRFTPGTYEITIKFDLGEGILLSDTATWTVVDDSLP